MTALANPRSRSLVLPRAHVLDAIRTSATHVFTHARINHQPRATRYTLAGFPSGNLRDSREWSCG